MGLDGTQALKIRASGLRGSPTTKGGGPPNLYFSTKKGLFWVQTHNTVENSLRGCHKEDGQNQSSDQPHPESIRNCGHVKNQCRQDQVNNANSAIIFLINH